MKRALRKLIKDLEKTGYHGGFDNTPFVEAKKLLGDFAFTYLWDNWDVYEAGWNTVMKELPPKYLALLVWELGNRAWFQGRHKL